MNSNCLRKIFLLNIFFKRHHKSNITKLTLNKSVIDCDQYLEFYDMVNDKNLVLNKDAVSKLKASFQHIQKIFYQNLTTSEYFEPILANLVNDSSPKQSELLDILTKIVFLNRDALSKWRKVYSKTLVQST